MRPVALHWCFEPLSEPADWLSDEPERPLCEEELGSVEDPLLLLPEEPLDELCACAPMIMHDALTAMILSSCFFIDPAFLGTVCLLPWKTTLLGVEFQQ